MKVDQIIDFAFNVGKLKRKKRAGWVKRKINNPESVAEHSFRTAVLALVLAPQFNLDVGKTVKIALIHDLAEYSVPDYMPSDNITKEKKHNHEKAAMETLCKGLESGGEILKLWKEAEEEKTKEAKLVKQIDKLEMMIQAKEYEEEQPDKDLEEFWNFANKIDFGNLKPVFEELKKGK